MLNVRCLISLAAAAAASIAHAEQPETRPLSYPVTRTVDHVDNYHGTSVADPYRWLEDANSAETAAWVAAQNKVTFGFLESIPQRTTIRERLTKLWNYERYGIPRKEGDRYFYSKNNGLQAQAVLYVAPSLGAEPKVLLDPNTLSADGTVALNGQSISEDGKLLAYGLSTGGSDWMEWRIRDVDSGKDLPDVLKWVKFSGAAWTPDGKGFYYSRYDAPKEGEKLAGVNFFQKLFYHRIGTPQEQDTLIYKRDDEKAWSFSPSVSDDGKYLIISVWKGTDPKNQIFYRDLSAPDSSVVELIKGFENGFDFLGNEGPVFWFKTDLAAPRGRVIAIDTRSPARDQWKELIPQGAETIDGVNAVGGRFAVLSLKDAHTQVKIYRTDGAFEKDVALPGMGSVYGFGGRQTQNETFFMFTGFTSPTTIYRYDMARGETSLYRKSNVAFNPDGYETKQVFYQSKDGTRVPMFITHKKGIALDGSNPTYLYGYGGFNNALTPWFGVSTAVWLEMGGVFAVANLRGGGEYGEEWHKAGTKLKKQNVFDDFIAAAEWLIANKYTSTPKLAIGGDSNGGLLVGACITQRPDLFGAALPGVGVMDMLRFHTFTIGWAWVDDYGSSANADDFKALYAYSPYHNLKKGTRFPATMVTTADHDDRVVPAHSFKFAAALQAAQAGPAPTVIRIDVKAGHGAGMSTQKMIDVAADKWAFLVKVLGM